MHPPAPPHRHTATPPHPSPGQADVLVKYLQDFARAQEKAGKIRYNTSVLSIDRVAAAPDRVRPPFAVRVSSSGSGASDERVACTAVVMATGLDKAHVPAGVQGIEHTVGYEDLPETGESFQGQAVAVLGFGNAALETADALAPYVDYVHLVPGRKPHAAKNMLVSWESRYVGHVRAVNAALLDSYLLKSLDGFTTAVVADKSVIVPCGKGLRKVCLFDGLTEHPPTSPGSNSSWSVAVGRVSRDDAIARRLVKLIGDAGFVHLEQNTRSRVAVGLSGATDEAGEGVVVEGDVTTDATIITVSTEALHNATLVNYVAELARRGGTPYVPARGVAT